MKQNKTLYHPYETIVISEDEWGFILKDGEFEDICVQIQGLEHTDNGGIECAFHILNKDERFNDKKLTKRFNELCEKILLDILGKIYLENMNEIHKEATKIISEECKE